jgi:MEDS: MEthanogen/methylotroph, DcmR Sensory domain/PucR C-terminal helix-turn-helix domain
MNAPPGSGVSPGQDSGLPGVALAERDHVCVFYRGPEERDSVLSAFFGAGYAQGDKCLCIADDHDVTAVAARLDRRPRGAPGQLTVLPATAYLTDGRFRPDQAYDRWDAVVAGFVAEGYPRVRASGELSWFLRQPAAEDGAGPLLEYEELCNRLVKRRPATIFCLYDLDLLDAGLLPGVLARHPTALARGLVFRAPWRIEDRGGGASDALLLTNQLLAGARTPAEIDGLFDGVRRAVLDPEAEPGPEAHRFLQALDGLAAPHRRALELEAALAGRPVRRDGAPGDDDPEDDAAAALAAELTRALLDGVTLEPADVARARSLGVDVDAPFRAVVVRPAADGADLARRAIRLACARPGETALLVTDDPDLADRLAGLGAVVGAGRAVTGAAAATGSYAEARQAAGFAEALGRPLLRHDDLGLFALLVDDGDPAAMARLVDEWLGPLLAPDGQRRSPALLATLAAYLDAGAHQQDSADALGVHVSTLKYRLGRLGEILGRDLSDPDVRFQLQVALAAHRTLSLLRPQGD